MIVTEGETVSRIDEEQFIALSTTTPLSRFNVTALRLMYRWYEQAAQRAERTVTFDPYEMTRLWREVNGRTLAADFGLPGERGATDDATVGKVLDRLKQESVVINVGIDDYLVLLPTAKTVIRDLVQPAKSAA